MKPRFFLFLLLLGLGAVAVLPAPAADKADAERIAKLIKQLASDSFAEREKATDDLDAIGLPALEALRKAAQSEELEVRMRAGRIVAKLEKQLESAKLLAATKVRLVCKDTPVAEAVQQLVEKSKYNITLYDPQKKLVDRKVTLDTGEVTFWEAFDQLCRKANLVMADGTQGGIIGPNPVPLPQPLPPIKQLPGQPGNAVPLPDPPQKDAPAQPPAKEAPAPAQPQKQEVPNPAGNAVPANRIQIQIAPAQPPQILPAQPAPGGRPVPAPTSTPNQIILLDGKPEARPTHYAGSVRIRALPTAPVLPGVRPGADEMVFALEVTPEPKMQVQSVVSLRIEKAVDDKGQDLTQAMAANDEAPAANVNPAAGVVAARLVAQPPGRGGLAQQVPVRLKKGDKASKSLKELAGTVTAQVRIGPEPLMTIDNILKAAGKSANTADGASLKVVDVSRADNGEVTLKVQLEVPVIARPGIGIGGGIQIQPIQIQFQPIPIQPPPPIPLPPPPLPNNDKLGLLQVAPAQPPKAVPAQALPAQVQPVQGRPVPAARPNINGLSLVDDKGKTLGLAVTASRGQGNGKTINYEYTMLYRPQKGEGEPAKLVYSGVRTATIDIPFTLKDVPLP
jgi:hypothetical protein